MTFLTWWNTSWWGPIVVANGDYVSGIGCTISLFIMPLLFLVAVLDFGRWILGYDFNKEARDLLYISLTVLCVPIFNMIILCVLTCALIYVFVFVPMYKVLEKIRERNIKARNK